MDIQRTRAIYLGLVVPDLGYTLYVQHKKGSTRQLPGRQPERAYGLLGEGINDPILGEGTGEGGLDTGVGLKAQSPDVVEVTQMFSFAWQEGQNF